MYKIKNVNMKIGIVILVFSIVVMIGFFFLFRLFYGYDINDVSNKTNAVSVYSINANESNKLFKDGIYQETSLNSMSIEEYNQKYFDSFWAQNIQYIVLFLLALFVLFIILWIFLRRIQMKNDLEIVRQFDNIFEADYSQINNSMIIKSYQTLCDKFKNNLNDYKRLNSYLSHEQKNSIAILKSRLEIDNHNEYMPSLNNMVNGIDDILTLSENENELPIEKVDVVLICATICDNYSRVYENISFSFDEDTEMEIYAKERWIYRAVENLVSNAIKYGEGKPIEVTVKSKNGSVIISVSDNGIGISELEQKKIFQNHYRVNEFNKNGYGIGLSLVSHVCDLCKGVSMVESKEGVGSTFYLAFSKIHKC